MALYRCRRPWKDNSKGVKYRIGDVVDFDGRRKVSERCFVRIDAPEKADESKAEETSKKGSKK